MGTNTDSEKRKEAGSIEFVYIDISSELSALRHFLSKKLDDGFIVARKALTVVKDIADSIANPRNKSLIEVCSTNFDYCPELLNAIVDFECELRTMLRPNLNDDTIIVHVEIPFDTTILKIGLKHLERKDDSGFEKYIESCLSDDTSVPPEVTKFLQTYRASFTDSEQVKLPISPLRHTRAWSRLDRR